MLNKIKADRITAMKNGEKEKRATLQLLLAKLEKEQIALKEELTKEQIETVINRSLKELDKEIESYIAVGRGTESQEAEKELLLSYMPKQLSEDEIMNEVVIAIQMAQSVGDGVGDVIRYLSSKLKGRANMGVVSKLVKEEFKNIG